MWERRAPVRDGVGMESMSLSVVEPEAPASSVSKTSTACRVLPNAAVASGPVRFNARWRLAANAAAAAPSVESGVMEFGGAGVMSPVGAPPA